MTFTSPLAATKAWIKFLRDYYEGCENSVYRVDEPASGGYRVAVHSATTGAFLTYV
ncbi:hypothetical protein [Pleomorphomonas sp. PLEO]|uniref:hypothetical protein n=1 Tax=Pleomorphomonas sp. PLEO TaxID=3239306 RepID=UPI00351E37B9